METRNQPGMLSQHHQGSQPYGDSHHQPLDMSVQEGFPGSRKVAGPESVKFSMLAGPRLQGPFRVNWDDMRMLQTGVSYSYSCFFPYSACTCGGYTQLLSASCITSAKAK